MNKPANDLPEGVRGIDGERINTAANEIAAAARVVRSFFVNASARGFVITLPWIGDVPIKLGQERDET